MLEAIASLASGPGDPFVQPTTLARAAEIGLLDAPHVRGRPGGLRRVVTRAVNGALEAIDPDTGDLLSEHERIARVLRAAGEWRG